MLILNGKRVIPCDHNQFKKVKHDGLELIYNGVRAFWFKKGKFKGHPQVSKLSPNPQKICVIASQMGVIHVFVYTDKFYIVDAIITEYRMEIGDDFQIFSICCAECGINVINNGMVYEIRDDKLKKLGKSRGNIYLTPLETKYGIFLNKKGKVFIDCGLLNKLFRKIEVDNEISKFGEYDVVQFPNYFVLMKNKKVLGSYLGNINEVCEITDDNWFVLLKMNGGAKKIFIIGDDHSEYHFENSKVEIKN